MKKFSKIQFKSWFVGKMETWEINASVNATYVYEVTQESEKAIKLHVYNPNKVLSKGFEKWYPKSVIENIDEVLGGNE